MWDKQTFMNNADQNWTQIAGMKPTFFTKSAHAAVRHETGAKRVTKDDEQDVPYFMQTYAYKMYAHAAEASPGCLLLGKQSMRAKKELLANFGVTAVVPKETTLKRLKEASGDMEVEGLSTHGAIQSDENWLPFFNDAWLLGGVHSLKIFYLDAKPTSTGWLDEVAVWNDGARRPRILGREVATLHAFGYRRVKPTSERFLGLTLGPTDKSAATGADFGRIFTAMSRVGSAADVLDKLRDEVAYENYLLPGLRLRLREPIPAYEHSFLESIHVRWVIQDGVLTVRRVVGKFAVVSLEGRCQRLATGFQTQNLTNPQVELYVDQSILQGSGVVGPY